MEANPEKVAELRKEFVGKKKELTTLRSKLKYHGIEKEKAYQELRSFKDKTKAHLATVKTLKSDRDTLTGQVQDFKKERNRLNIVVKQKSSNRVEADKKRKEILGKLNVKEDPGKIKGEIRKLEHKIETEVMPFSKEQQLQKRIKELKGQHAQMQELGDVWKEINTATANFAETRRKAEESHQQMQQTADKSQEKHKQITALYQQVKKLRAEEKKSAEKYLKLKAEYEELKKSMDQVSVRVKELSTLFKDQDKKSLKKKIREKTAEVQEKIKKRKKLSTEDILAFQASEE